MKPVLIRSRVYRCASCKAWNVRLPYWAEADEECRRCGCTSFTYTEGRPYGPGSALWDVLVRDFDEMSRAFADDPEFWTVEEHGVTLR